MADVKEAQDNMPSKAVSWIQNKKHYAYKRKGNEEQACFNMQVEKALQDTEDALPWNNTKRLLQ